MLTAVTDLTADPIYEAIDAIYVEILRNFLLERGTFRQIRQTDHESTSGVCQAPQGKGDPM